MEVGKPSKVVLGSTPPEVWLVTGNHFVLIALLSQTARIITEAEMGERIDHAYAQGLTVVFIFDPLVTSGILH